MAEQFSRPVRATQHCRHYSYVLPITRPDSGPQCGRGLDLRVPTATRPCMPNADCPCTLREDYTEAEREAWKAWGDARLDRLGAAVQTLPRAIPLRTSGRVSCPSCEGGTIHYARWHRGAELACSTPNCCEARFSIAAGKEWPAHV